MVSDRIFDDATTAAAAAEDAELQAAIDVLMPPRGASTATGAAAEWGVGDWQRHSDNTPLPPDHPGSDERMAATERYLAEELKRLQTRKFVKDVIDRSVIDVPTSFAPRWLEFSVADPSIVHLANPEGMRGAPFYWYWLKRGWTVLEERTFSDDQYYYTIREYPCRLRNYKKLCSAERRLCWEDKDSADILAFRPNQTLLLFDDLEITETVAQLCHPEIRTEARHLLCWLRVARQ